MSRCKACGAQILWLRMDGGVQLPLDPVPVFVTEGGEGQFVNEKGEIFNGTVSETDEGTPAFEVHWYTCPYARLNEKPSSTTGSASSGNRTDDGQVLPL